jgi:hypothetical protein
MGVHEPGGGIEPTGLEDLFASALARGTDAGDPIPRDLDVSGIDLLGHHVDKTAAANDERDH